MQSVSPPLRVFVSHSSKDHVFATRLIRDLRATLGHEHTVWYDGHNLTGGDEWWPMIVNELDQCTVFLVILSPDAMKSRWVLDEINIAWRRKNSHANIRFIPLLHLPCDVRRDLETLQIISFLDPKPYDDAFNELLKAIQPFGKKIRLQSVAKNHLPSSLQQPLPLRYQHGTRASRKDRQDAASEFRDPLVTTLREPRRPAIDEYRDSLSGPIPILPINNPTARLPPLSETPSTLSSSASWTPTVPQVSLTQPLSNAQLIKGSVPRKSRFRRSAILLVAVPLLTIGAFLVVYFSGLVSHSNTSTPPGLQIGQGGLLDGSNSSPGSNQSGTGKPTVVTTPSGLTLILLDTGPLVPGQSIQLQGKGFSPQGAVTFTDEKNEPMLILNSQTNSVQADKQGAFAVTVNDATWAPGHHLVVVRDIATGRVVKLPVVLATGPFGKQGFTPTPTQNIGGGGVPTPVNFTPVVTPTK